jgi:hypothetical protein
MDVSIAKYAEIGSTRKYGVEIETSCCSDYEDLKGNTRFGCKPDPSISGEEFDSPILYGDDGFNEIEDFLAFASDHDWAVNHNCGCHTHYDMRDESEDQLWSTYYAYNLTYSMWAACVPSWRTTDYYCTRPHVNHADISYSRDEGDGFANYAYHAERYEYLNIVAYDDHRTFEVRLLEGTLDPTTILNWVSLHARFIDRVHDMSFDTLRAAFPRARRRQFAKLVEIIDDAPLTDWLAARARENGTPLRGPGSAQN